MEKLLLIFKLLAGTPDLECAAEAIYFEARNQSYRGQLAVGEVIVTRGLQNETDLCYTVHTDCQFEYYCDGKKETINDNEAYNTARMAAFQAILSGPGEAFYYHNTSINPHWPFPHLYTIGEHVFYSK